MLYAILTYIFTLDNGVIAMATATLEKSKKAKTVQMNVRIDGDVKRRGDRNLARAGYSPSQAVRALWTFAAEAGADDPRVLRDFLEGNAEQAAPDSAASEKDRRIRSMQEARQRISDFVAESGTARQELPEDADERLAYYDELREEAHWDRLAERGLS